MQKGTRLGISKGIVFGSIACAILYIAVFTIPALHFLWIFYIFKIGIWRNPPDLISLIIIFLIPFILFGLVGGIIGYIINSNK